MRKAKLSEIEQAVQDYLDSIGIRSSVSYKGETVKKDGSSKGWKCDEWEFFLLNSPQSTGKGATFRYFTGIGHRVDLGPGFRKQRSLGKTEYEHVYIKPAIPPIAGLLYSLLSDARANDMSFNYWCDECGLSKDSISAFQTYQSCCETGEKLKQVFSPEELEKISELLEDY